MRILLVVLLNLFLITGCSDDIDDSLISVEVGTVDFALEIPAYGEVEPVVSHSIMTPGRQPKAIDWLIGENELVKKGQVVARFDAEQLTLNQRREELAMMLLDRDIQQKFAEKNKQQNELNSEDELIEKEFAFVDAYAIDDLMLYSKLEIIDTMSNKEFLGAKEEFIDWKSESLEERTDSAMDVLDIRKEGHQKKYDQHTKALAQLEVYAPIDGLLIYEKNNRGEKPSVGQTVFPGSVIAKIPDLSAMQAKLLVIDKYAIGLKNGIPVDVRLDANPDYQITGKVTAVSGFPRSIERGNPVKYYEVTVALDSGSEIALLPGQKVSANIRVESFSNKLTVPLQAIHNDKGEVYVYIDTGGDIERRNVTLGVKSLYEAEIVNGLVAGERVILNVPEMNHG